MALDCYGFVRLSLAFPMPCDMFSLYVVMSFCIVPCDVLVMSLCTVFYFTCFLLQKYLREKKMKC